MVVWQQQHMLIIHLHMNRVIAVGATQTQIQQLGWNKVSGFGFLLQKKKKKSVCQRRRLKDLAASQLTNSFSLNTGLNSRVNFVLFQIILSGFFFVYFTLYTFLCYFFPFNFLELILVFFSMRKMGCDGMIEKTKAAFGLCFIEYYLILCHFLGWNIW